MTDITFTFGIVTYVNEEIPQHLIDCISSIRRLNLPQYEIIVVGSERHLRQDYHFETHWQDLRIVDFNENIKQAWITKKKNIITTHAKYNNIVYLHDYIVFKPDWYEGFRQFGDNFVVCMTKMINFHEERGSEENRFRDLVLDTWSVTGKFNKLGIPLKNRLIPYDLYQESMSPYMYISGGYWVAKKEFMSRFPLNESLAWGQGEDVEWSRRWRNQVSISFNPYSTVKVGKMNNHRNFQIMTPEDVAKFKQHYFL